ncbi:GNAT family N-acetyltransferase [Bacillus massiliglaciei]|uniref:GNAT family N-acetyltransferase n=1 Tax=Bacillus massiliglaciei TaxID=1816693 RepID=UPI0018FE85E7|nr:GNAT family N-acetyltransferase [Bacillus massiliglaciei]
MQIRKASFSDISSLAEVHIRSWQTTYKGIIPDRYLSAMNKKNREKSWERNLNTLHNITYVAETDEKQLVGFASGGPEQSHTLSYQGEIYAVYLLQNYQRRGIGKKLLTPLVQDFISKGFKDLIIWALEDNPSCLFYEKLGGSPIEHKTMTIAGKTLAAVGYVWKDISLFTPS